jgi:pyrroloquinoline quinone biosynthesis protein B
VFIHVLGSAAGGGFPQWNCGCSNCEGVRKGTIAARARTQESVAISADNDSWFLLNASPEIRQQIEAFSGLYPRTARDTPIAGIFLTNGDLDHCLGLLSLRESQPLTVYATERVWRGFTEGNVLFRTLERFEGQITWRPLQLNVTLPVLLTNGSESGLSVCPVAIPGKLPIHLGELVPDPEDNIGLRISDERAGKVLAYLPAVGSKAPGIEQATAAADLLFFDGTFWSSDELVEQQLGDKRAEDMAHWPLGGDAGSLSWLRKLSGVRRVLIHVNNTNPVLRDDSSERKLAETAGVEVAYDGMEFHL